MREQELLLSLREGAFDDRLRPVYGEARLARTRERIVSVAEGFCAHFDAERARELSVFSSPGRTELGGNHTDHQGGWGLAGSVDLDTIACAARNDTPIIRVLSQGHDPISLDVSDTTIRESERSCSVALVRGIAARIAALGYPVGGFDAYTETTVLRGSGLSSSAAFEVLIGQIMNQYFCGGALNATELAVIGQYAENVYYGKPCGLLDQMACATGGAIAIDFAGEPVVRRCAVDLAREGYALVIIDSGANHSDLDGEYAAIPEEMRRVARYFGKERLCDVDEAAFLRERERVLAECGERPTLRAEHYFAETKRALAQYEALERGDFARFLALVRESGASSEEKLQNVSTAQPDGDRLLRVIRRARSLAGETGAARVHGGGFAGTAQAYVPLEKLDAFVREMEEEFGTGRCHIVSVRDVGVTQLIGTI